MPDLQWRDVPPLCHRFYGAKFVSIQETYQGLQKM
jgi:hypothetical protein